MGQTDPAAALSERRARRLPKLGLRVNYTVFGKGWTHCPLSGGSGPLSSPRGTERLQPPRDSFACAEVGHANAPDDRH